MQLEYSVSRTGDNNESIRTSFELNNAKNIRVSVGEGADCTVIYSDYKDSYVLSMGFDLTVRIPRALATELVANLTTDLLATEVAASTSTYD